MFDSVSLTDHGLNPSNSLHALQYRQPSPTSTSSAMDRHLDAPQTYEGLLAANTSLKTRVSELEVINELFRGRVAELEQSDAAARRSEMIVRGSLEEAHRREEGLKRRLEDTERQATEHQSQRDSLSNGTSGEPSAKKIRLADVVEQSSTDPVKYESPKSI